MTFGVESGQGDDGLRIKAKGQEPVLRGVADRLEHAEVGTKANALNALSSSLRATGTSKATRHGVSSRGAAPSAWLGAGCAILLRFLAEFALGEANALGMTFQVRLLRSRRSLAMTQDYRSNDTPF